MYKSCLEVPALSLLPGLFQLVSHTVLGSRGPILSKMTSFAITNVRVFDGENVLEDADIVVEDGIIKQVGHGLNSGHLPSISMPGHTLLPGLIDAHCHPERELSLLEQAYRFGITTIMDMHNVHENVVQLKRWAQERKDIPDVKSCHYAATIKGGWPAWVEMKLPGVEVSRLDG